MHVGVDVTSMHTNFGGRGLTSFGDKIGSFGLWTIESQMFIAQVLLENIIESCVFDHTGTARKHSPT